MLKGTAVTPAVIVLLAIVAFLAVMNFAILPEKETKTNQNTANSKATRLTTNRNLSASDDAANNTNAQNPVTEWTYREREDTTSTGAGFCSYIDVYNHDSGDVLTTLWICEDNVTQFSEANGIITLSTTCGRMYTYANDEGTVNNGTCPIGIGGMTIVAPGEGSTFNPTAGWKTYTNASIGYSIKYPPDWKTTEEFGKDSAQLLPPGVNKGYMGENDLAGAITITTKDGGNSLVEPKNVVINGLPAVQGKLLGIVTFKAAKYSRDGVDIFVKWSQKYDKGEYDQTLSTFTFTN